MSQHFWFNKKLVTGGDWASLPKASKSIFPVIASHRNLKGMAFPGEKRIARLAGVSEKTARAGIVSLSGFPGFSIRRYMAPSGRISKRFFIDAPDLRSGKAFPFFNKIITDGQWAVLSPSAKALYVAMRTYGFFDKREEVADEDWSDNPDDGGFRDRFRDREYDLCNEPIVKLSKMAGFCRDSFPSALVSLKKNGLICNEKTMGHRNCWSVRLVNQ